MDEDLRGFTMHFSLMRLRRFLMKASYARSVTAAAVTLAMLFALTPCCEANAAPSPIHSGSDGHDHGDARDHGMPPMTDPCLMWLDNNFNALDTNIGLSIPGYNPHPDLFATPWSIHPAGETPSRLLLYRHSPPPSRVPLYLLIERLLI
jgi:hypothetical protein